MRDLGFNYRVTDIQCALGLSQLNKLPTFVARRREIASRYDEEFADVEGIHIPVVSEDRTHAYHLYVIRIVSDGDINRRTVFQRLRENAYALFQTEILTDGQYSKDFEKMASESMYTTCPCICILIIRNALDSGMECVPLRKRLTKKSFHCPYGQG